MNVVSAEENPLGEGGERLHEWAISLVMGRNMSAPPAEAIGGTGSGRARGAAAAVS